jgi:Predicted membrane protein
VALAAALAIGLTLDPTVQQLLIRGRLSDLGRAGAPGAFPFGYGLLLAGLLGLVFVRAWVRVPTDPLGRAAAVVAGVAFLGLAVAGLFPVSSAVHEPALTATYLAGWAAPLLDAGLRDATPERSRAAVVLTAGAAIVGVLWAVRALVAATFVLSGPTSVLLPTELATLALFAGWVLFRSWAGPPTGAEADDDADGVGASAGGR